MKKVKILIMLVVLILFSATQLKVSAQEIQKGSILINAGIGFGYGFNGVYATGLPIGIIANVEYSILDDVGIGGYLAYTRGSYNAYYNQGLGDKYYYSSVDIGVRGSYHFARLLRVNKKEFDPYAGVILGFASRNSDYDYYPGDHGGRIGAFAGARYYFSNNFGVFGEVGYSVHFVTAGMTFKL